MATINNYQNISVQVSTATASSARIIGIDGSSVITCTTTLLDAALGIALPALATTTRFDFTWPNKTSIYKIGIMCRGTPAGRLYVTIGPGSTNQKIVQNFDLSYLGANGSWEFTPRVLQIADPGDSADAATVRVYIVGHGVASVVPYQISFETEEYR